MNKITLPQSFYEQADKPSDSFLATLRGIDPLLLAYWNRFRGRWVVDRYGCDNDGHTHGPQCPRQNVLIAQTGEGEYMPCNERIFERLRAMDMWRQADSAEELDRRGIEARERVKRDVNKSIRDDVRHIILDDKAQFKKIQTAIQMHDLRPNDIARANLGADGDLAGAVIGQRSQGAKIG